MALAELQALRLLVLEEHARALLTGDHELTESTAALVAAVDARLRGGSAG